MTIKSIIALILVLIFSSVKAQMPYFEDFDGFTTGTVISNTNDVINGGWTRTTTSTTTNGFLWRVGTGTVNRSPNTGPSSDHTGGGNFIYTEASLGQVGDVSTIVSPLIDLSKLDDANLSFWWHRYGSQMGPLYIDVHNGTSWINNIWGLSSQPQMAHSDPWKEAVISLSNFIGDTIRVRFRGIKQPGFQGDMSIDDVQVEPIFDTDLKVVDIFSNELNVCPGIENISVKLRNDGDTIFFQQDTFRLEFRKYQNAPIISYLYDTNVVRQAHLLPNDSLIIKIPNIFINYLQFFSTELYEETKFNTLSGYTGIVELDPIPDSIKLETDTSFKTLRCFNDKYLLSVEANSSNVIWQVSYGNGFLNYKFYDSTFTILPTDTFLMVRPNICNNLYYPDTFYLASIARPSKVIPIIRGNRDTIANCSDSSEFCVFIPNRQDPFTEFTWFKHGRQFDGDTFKLSQRYFTTGQVDQVSVQIRTGLASSRMGFPSRVVGSNLSSQSINEVDFSILKQTVLNSFDVYSSTLGKCFVEIIDLGSGSILDTISIDTMSAGLLQIALNKKLTVGNYRLRIHAITTSFYQQSTTPTNMYYSTDSSLKIIGSNPTFGVFYNWRIGSGCVTNEEVLLYSFCLVNIEEESVNINTFIYPNPSTGIFKVNATQIIEEILVRDISGKIVYSKENSSKQFLFDLSNNSNGIYFVQLRTENGVVNKKIVLQ